MDISSIEILFPLFFLIAGGYGVGRCFNFSETELVRAVTDFFMPLLVFHSFCTTPLTVVSLVQTAGAVAMVVALGFGTALIYCRAFRLNFKEVAPPLLFMNSGFLGIPLMKLWGGDSAVNLIIVYDQIQTFIIFTLGLVIVTGSYRLSGVREMIRSPLIWAILGGVAVNLLAIPVPTVLLDAMQFGGAAAPAMATFAIGLMLNRFRISCTPHVIAGVAMRLVGGGVFGALAVLLLGFSAQVASVVVIASALPSAVFSVVLPVRYGVDGSYASSVLLLSTLCSFATLPLLFQFVDKVW